MKFYRFAQLDALDVCIHEITKKDATLPLGFSLALHTGEDPIVVGENRKALQAHFSHKIPYCFVTAQQTHSDHVHVVTQKAYQGWENDKDAIANCDALITDQQGVMLCILTADCVPILLCDPKQKVVAAVHAGWRGTQAKILAKTLYVMQERFGCDFADIVAGIGPAIGVCCYEVGEEVASHFFEIPEAVTKKKNGKYMLDLPLANRLQLMEAGVQEAHIEMSDICTACENGSFFSYRKEQGCSGRFMSLIGMRNEE